MTTAIQIAVAFTLPSMRNSQKGNFPLRPFTNTQYCHYLTISFCINWHLCYLSALTVNSIDFSLRKPLYYLTLAMGGQRTSAVNKKKLSSAGVFKLWDAPEFLICGCSFSSFLLHLMREL
jgi:hypothetical protein